MGISRLSVLMIQTNEDVRCEIYAYDRSTKKYAGAINLWKRGHFHTHIVSTACVYSSKEEAIQAMEALVKEIKELEI